MEHATQTGVLCSKRMSRGHRVEKGWWWWQKFLFTWPEWTERTWNEQGNGFDQLKWWDECVGNNVVIASRFFYNIPVFSLVYSYKTSYFQLLTRANLPVCIFRKVLIFFRTLKYNNTMSVLVIKNGLKIKTSIYLPIRAWFTPVVATVLTRWDYDNGKFSNYE